MHPQARTQAVLRSDAMRRRIIVFFGVFALCAIASLSYTFVRPAIYVASARLQVTPGAKLETGEAVVRDSTPAILVEMQVLNSRPLLEKVVARLADEGGLGDIGSDPVTAVQNMLEVTRVEGSSVIQVKATGAQRPLLARLVNGLVEEYQEQQATAGRSSTQSELSDARDEVRIVDARVVDRKRAVEEFRIRSNIMSGERDENRTLSGLKGLGASLSAATEREAIAEGKAQALEQAAQGGKRSPLAKDNPTVAAMEQRLSQWREEMRALERQFTPQYLDVDPNARALKTRIASLEQQLDSERGRSQDLALASAREELASARATTRRLQQQLADGKQEAQAFSRNFVEYQAMQEELRGLEQMRTSARQKLVALEASEATRKPRTQVLESATTPDTAWRPLYWRDAGISLAGSLALGFLAVWFVEFFNRSEPVPAGPSTVIVPQPWVAVGQPERLRVDSPPGAAALPHEAQPALLGAPAQARELTDAEARRLLAEAAPENLPLLVCLLCGLTPAEIAELRVAHVDTDSRLLSIPGETGRVLPLERPLLDLMAQDGGLAGDTPLFPGAAGRPLTAPELHTRVMSSALDAGLDDAQRITPDTLRHTYVAFLVRQGLRFSELGKLVGPTPAEALNTLASLAPGLKRVGLDKVDRMLPAVRDLAQA